MGFWLGIAKKENIKKVLDTGKFALNEKDHYSNKIKEGDGLILYGSPKRIHAICSVTSHPKKDDENIFGERKLVFTINIKKVSKTPVEFSPFISKLKFLSKINNVESRWATSLMGRSIKPIPKEDFDLMSKSLK